MTCIAILKHNNQKNFGSKYQIVVSWHSRPTQNFPQNLRFKFYYIPNPEFEVDRCYFENNVEKNDLIG